MKPLKLLLMAAAFSLIAQPLFAQGLYLKAHTGYGLGSGKQSLESAVFNFKNVTSTDNTSSSEQIFLSLGDGLRFSGAVGYLFNENIGAELAVSYLLGAEKTANSRLDNFTTREDRMSATMLSIIPTLVVQTGREGLNPYAKIGLVVGQGKVTLEFDQESNGTQTNREWEFEGGTALGLQASIGALYSIGPKMSLFGEVSMTSLSYTPTKGTLVKATLDGTDELPSLTIREKEIALSNSITSVSGTPPSDDEPAKALEESLPFGSIGLNIGIRISL